MTNNELTLIIPDAPLRAAYARERAAADQYAKLNDELWRARQELDRLERAARRAEQQLRDAVRDRRHIEEGRRC